MIIRAILLTALLATAETGENARCLECHGLGALRRAGRGIHVDPVLFNRSMHGGTSCVSCHDVGGGFPHSGLAIARCESCHQSVRTYSGRFHENAFTVSRFRMEGESVAVVAGPALPEKVPDASCLKCHEGTGMTGSSHLTRWCIDCHTDAGEKHDIPPRPLKPVACDRCHVDEGIAFAKTIHGRLRAEGEKTPAACVDCHDTHGVRSSRDPLSLVAPLNVASTCLKCHADPALAASGRFRLNISTDSFADSVHGKVVKSGAVRPPATCADCHGAHEINPASLASSRVSRFHISETCGRCHEKERLAWEASIHGSKNAAGDTHAALCVDCHNSHYVKRPGAAQWQLEVISECGTCHEEKIRSYRDSFHGEVTQLGYSLVAKCADCHGAHEILPASDSRSLIAPGANLVATCGKCHEGSTPSFAKFEPHADYRNREKFPEVFYTYFFMTSLLLGTLTFFTLHTLLWFYRSMRERKEMKKSHHAAASQKYYVRFSLFQRIVHGFVMVSFMGLALTGLPLRFSKTNWAAGIENILGGIESARYLHRLFAITTVFYSTVFAIYAFRMIASRKEKGLLWGTNSLIPHPQDAFQMWGMFRYFIGKGPMPRFDRWTYYEKFDFWGEMWGVFVIGGSGLMLWFPVFFTRWTPGWVLNCAQVVHGIEALLATAVIFSVHFFNAHFRPEKFPVDPVIFTGRITEEEFKHERPIEYERLRAAGELAKLEAPPPPAWLMWLARIVAVVTVPIGIILIILMLLSVLF